MNDFRSEIREGIPDHLPGPNSFDTSVNHAPRRRDLLTTDEKKLALRNALRYFPGHLHGVLAPEFAAELHDRGRIYMYRYRPSYEMKARPISDYPHKS
ncbi:MAG: urocanate hydratase, partial [Bacteroidales bacterium]